MLEKDCFLIGKILKPYGVQRFYKNSQRKYPLDLDIQKIDFFLIDQNKILVPFFIESLKEINSNTLLLKFEKLDTKEQLEKILKKDVYVPLKWIIKSKNNQTNILDFIVFDHEKGVLGKVDYIDTQNSTKTNLCFK